jgi:hypothetical protein
MKRCLHPIGLVTLVAIACAANQPKKFGPEWTYDEEERKYFKPMQIKVVRNPGGNVRGYHLDLEYDKVWLADTDGNIATSVNLNNSIELKVRKNPKGLPKEIRAVVNGSVHFDLNCDGAWDVWYDLRSGDHRKANFYILLDGSWVLVHDSRGRLRFGDEESSFAASPDGKTEYTWDGKVWNAKPAKP